MMATLSGSLSFHRRTENLQDNEGNTPLHMAVSNDNPQCVKLLLIHGADVNRSECGRVVQ